jgi:hypothetical protein
MKLQKFLFFKLSSFFFLKEKNKPCNHGKMFILFFFKYKKHFNKKINSKIEHKLLMIMMKSYLLKFLNRNNKIKMIRSVISVETICKRVMIYLL